VGRRRRHVEVLGDIREPQLGPFAEEKQNLQGVVDRFDRVLRGRDA
jgi:hypothetical protein